MAETATLDNTDQAEHANPGAKQTLKLCRVVGARPQFMQVPALRSALEARGHEETIVHTGQHYDDAMSKVFFEQLGLPHADINLDIRSGTHGSQTGRMMEKLEALIKEHDFDAVVVDGDTNSTLAAALVAAKLHIPCVHVEAGLRCFDRSVPEEVNRIGADHVCDLLCAPTQTAMDNLAREGLAKRAVLTGDVMYDAFTRYRPKADHSILSQLNLTPGQFDLMTVHRAENTEDPDRLQRIMSAVADAGHHVVFPVHPRTRPLVDRWAKTAPNASNITLIDPIGYLQILALLDASRFVLTDSGGLQREAFFAHKPAVVFRETAEWLEQVELGWSLLAGADSNLIQAAYQRLKTASRPKADPAEIYGYATAGKKIAAAIEELLIK